MISFCYGVGISFLYILLGFQGSWVEKVWGGEGGEERASLLFSWRTCEPSLDENDIRKRCVFRVSLLLLLLACFLL
jgi:hypothetical protein